MKNILTCFFMIIGFDLSGQGYVFGLNPHKMKWHQINTDRVKVIYPEKNEKKAQRVANMITYLYDSDKHGLGDKKGKVSIILQNQSTQSNGFAVLGGPLRSEFFNTPPQYGFAGAVNWTDLLTIHEYRHIQQFFNSRRGITNLLATAFGQNSWGLLNFLALPRWFLEGDAVFYESAITNGGRGRMPSFERAYRALLLQGKLFNYEKASAGSFKDFVPNQDYNKGYHMTTHVRNKYGDRSLNEAVADAAHFAGVIFPLSQGFRRHIGLRTPQLYRETFNELGQRWKQEATQLLPTQSTTINDIEKKGYTSYKMPYWINNTELVVEKSGFLQIPDFIKIDLKGKESRVVRPGLYSSLNLTPSFKNGTLLWAENTYDQRWGNQDFSVITTFKDGRKTKITERTKYFAPEFSPSGKRIATVYVSEQNDYEIHILNLNGDIIERITTKENYFISFPRWKDAENLVFVIQKNSKNALAQININTKKLEVLNTFESYQISYPRASGGLIYFSSMQSGIENIHVIDPHTGKEHQVTSTLLGATQPSISPDGYWLAFSEFDISGWNVKRMKIDATKWLDVRENNASDYLINDFITDGNILEEVPNRKFETSKFKKSSNLLNFHSWQPVLISSENTPLIGGTVYSENVFSTAYLAAHYQYNVNEKNSKFTASAIYAELFPVFQASYSQSDRSKNGTAFSYLSRTEFNSISVDEWLENDLELSILLPFNLTSGNHFGKLEVKSSYHGFSIRDYNSIAGVKRTDQGITPIKKEVGDFFLNGLEFNLNFQRQQKTSLRQVGAKWGQFIDVRFASTFDHTNNDKPYFHSKGRFFFPGLYKTHSTSLRLGYRHQPTTNLYEYADLFPYARGVGKYMNDRSRVIGLDYNFPLWMPDVSLGALAFLKRIKANIFYDVGRSKLDRVNLSQHRVLTETSPSGAYYRSAIKLNHESYGVDIRFDVRLLRMLNLDFGIRFLWYSTDNLEGQNLKGSTIQILTPIINF